MEKRIFYALLLALPLIFSILYFSGFLKLTGFFVGFGQPASEFKWWNISWHYRVRLEVNTSSFERKNWPIEYKINFTDLLPYGSFDENSTRVIEYSQEGELLGEIPSQFEKDDDFNSENNALGTLVFFLNGSNPANTKRIFFVYYDSLENGPKEKREYPSSISYSWDGEELNVNASGLSYWIDTLRGENTSGLYRVRGIASQQDIWSIPGETERTIEYSQYSNGSNNLSFDFKYNMSLKFSGPVRLVFEQKGYETFWNSEERTNEGFMIKRYYFYDFGLEEEKWIKIETIFKNLASYEIERNSTFAGALGLDVTRAFGSSWQSAFGNTSFPGWWYASDFWSSFHTGIIHANRSTENFFIQNSSSKDRIGIELNSTLIPPGSSISTIAILHFNDTSGDYTQVRELRNKIENPEIITQFLPEAWYVEIIPSTNFSIYNRNESILIKANISLGDPYNLTTYINATLDMGTSSEADDQTIILYDDGSHEDEVANDKVFTNSFVLPNNAQVGIWTINFTAYSEDLKFLNSTLLSFNVTDVLNVSVVVLNKKPMVNSLVVANVYVKNYRQDSWVAEAEINCTYDSSEVLNKTDYNNGTYSVNFTAPSEEGVYYLFCNATKNGNFGNNSDSFTTEPGKTNLTITAEPSNPIVYNITLYRNQSFAVLANATNYGNGTAYSTNISLELLNGWTANSTLEECGDIEKQTFCLKSFNITVPKATPPGNYYINVSVAWRNPDTTISINKTEVNVTVASNPLINISEEKVSGEAGDGIWNLIGNFTILSVGNDKLENISFSCYSGIVCSDFEVEFIPSNVSVIPAGSNYSIAVNVSVPLGYPNGTYTGIVNVSSENDGFDSFEIEINIPPKTFVNISTGIANYTAKNITQKDNETFSFEASATNIGKTSARSLNLSLELPVGWVANSYFESCNNLTKDESCLKSFSITVPNATPPGDYYINVTANWTNLDNSIGTNKTSLRVTVASHPLINVSEEIIYGIVPDATEQTVGNFTILSIGNDKLENVSFSCYSGIVCSDFFVEFIPSNVSSIPAGSNYSVAINVSVPLGYATGTYTGIVNASSGNDGFDVFEVEIFVPINRTWTMFPEYCQRAETPEYGIACEVNVSNLGNTFINFTISPEEGNYTRVNETYFSIERQSWHVFSITYNVTGIPMGIYNSTFIIDATEEANPDNKTLIVTLLPYVEPIINISIIPNTTEQFSSIEIFANITDKSNTGIAWARVNITQPNATLQTFEMEKIYESGNLSTWYLKYEAENTSLQGRYNITVFARDNVGNTGEKNSSFIIFAKLSISVSTLSEKYYQGDTGSIYYSVRDASNQPLAKVNVTFRIEDSNKNLTFKASYLTNEDGMIYPLPSFTLPSDSPLGVYTLISDSEYVDEESGTVSRVQRNSSFQVLSRTVTVTGLFADVETAVVWYPENIMKFGILVYNGEGKPVDPTSMNLTVYDPAGNLYFSSSLSQMSRQATGFYTYSYAMPANTPSGMYLAVLNATQNEFQTMKLKAFRVARGGPYDLWLELFEHEVMQGDYLDFAVTIENKGEVSQDVYLEWWVSSENKTYYSSSGWVYTPAHSNQTVTQQAYIFTSQPVGTYELNVKMTYDTVQPPLIVSETFIVTVKELILPNITYPNITYPIYIPSYPVVTPAPVAIPTPTAVLPASISIINYNSNISLVRGTKKTESVTVKNTGIADLANVTVFLVGIPTTWFTVVPDFVSVLPPENSSVFLINFDVPKNALPGEYRVILTAVSGVVSDQKTITITVYESLEELLKVEIEKLKEDVKALEREISIAEKEGKNVSSVLVYLEEIKTQIEQAEINLANNRTEKAIENIATAKGLIEKAREILLRLKPPVVEVFVLPYWLILLIAVIIACLIIAIILIRKKGMPSIRIKPALPALPKKVEKVEAKEELVREKEKLLRTLEILEKERKEGIISLASYTEMKKSIEERLQKIEKKLK
ncbi:MAG: NEW3 domain-containing protein [Candidatus Aenigmatarchaeota archaeon]